MTGIARARPFARKLRELIARGWELVRASWSPRASVIVATPTVESGQVQDQRTLARRNVVRRIEELRTRLGLRSLAVAVEEQSLRSAETAPDHSWVTTACIGVHATDAA